MIKYYNKEFKMTKVKDYPNLEKSNGAVINTDNSEYTARLNQLNERQRIKQLEHNQKKLEDKLDVVNDTLNSILALLKEK